MLADLRIGNTDLLKEILEKHIQDEYVKTNILEGMPYSKEGPLDHIVESIKKLHDKYHPGLIKPNSKIAVGSGASQLISFFLWANKDPFVLEPYWFRIPIMTEKHRNTFKLSKDAQLESVGLITYPNNPDGALITNENKNTWYDCVYLWPWYFNDGEYDAAIERFIETPKNTSIFSLSKMTGHCGVRFGWAVTEDDSTYKQICDYVEYESGGVSYDSQTKASSIVDKVTQDKKWNETLKNIGCVLESRKRILEDFCKKKGWSYKSHPGMFAWVTTEDKHIAYSLQDIGILGTFGSKCGGLSNQIRLNLAVDDKTWQNLVNILKTKG